MSTHMEPPNWTAGRSGNRDESHEVNCTSQPLPSVMSATVHFAKGNQNPECSITSREESFKESAEPNLASVLEHCFKQYRLRDAYPHYFFKLKKSRFGPPKSRRRILIAPPMGAVAPGGARPQPPAPSGPEQTAPGLHIPPEAKGKISTEEEDLQELEAWIEERKKLQDLLNNCVNLEQWLTVKQPVTEQEECILGRIKEAHEAKKAKVEAKMAAVSSVEHPMPNVKQRKIIPVIESPYPESLMTLQNLLHKQKVTLLDLFYKVDRTKTMKFKRADFIKIIQKTKVPISKNDLEDIIIYLSSSKKGEFITNDDLAQCQKIWMDSIREQWKQSKHVACMTRQRVSTACDKIKDVSSRQTKLTLLEIPPMNTEMDAMHLTYNQMEEAGKRYKEMRRQQKRKINPLEFAEQCRMVKSGDPVVDAHCMPSTMEGEVGELVDQHRLTSHLVYTQCVKLCEKYGVPLTEKLLKKALLYPGDRLVRMENNFLKMRQPGGYYGKTGLSQVGSSKEKSRSSLKFKQRKPKPELFKEEKVIKEKIRNCRWESFGEFKKLMKNHLKKQIPPEEICTESLLDARLHKTQEALAQQYLQKELKRMFAHLNPLTNPNNFWPGHLLDKLRLYLPQMERDEGDALFSHVSCTRPVYPAIYNPHRNWPVSGQRYVTYGDPESRKHYYYI
ncbi:EF-hand calcium-binding domain-containing protein 12 [Elgaria multicarinata webbii]|uniref:EF-hand calcium-binding domain-containing protein 12 n=1 Tax=Elgaria multicarinata webbii TaxID=159646 RepID=UPI002FCCFF5B